MGALAMITRLTVFLKHSTAAAGNNQKIKGTVLDQAGNPQARSLLLMKESGAVAGNLAPPIYQQMRLGRSDINGEWVFPNLYPGYYTVIAYDSTGQYDPTIKAGLIPETME